MKDIDQNMKYFHTTASIRRRRKMMVEIKKGIRVLRDPRSIKGEFRQFYKSLYK